MFAKIQERQKTRIGDFRHHHLKTDIKHLGFQMKYIKPNHTEIVAIIVKYIVMNKISELNSLCEVDVP